MFAETIAQGGALTALLRESGVTVEEVYGHTASEARRAIVETFRSKDVRVVALARPCRCSCWLQPRLRDRRAQSGSNWRGIRRQNIPFSRPA